MSARIDELLSQLASDPSDDALFDRFVAGCLTERAYGHLLDGCRSLLEDAAEDRVGSLAAKLATRCEAAVADAEDARQAAAMWLRVADLRALGDDGAARAAEAVARSWEACPSAEAADRAWNLMGRPAVEHAPDALLVARSRVAPDEAKRVLLGLLSDRWSADNDTAPAERILMELSALSPTDRRVRSRLRAVAATQLQERPPRHAEPVPEGAAEQASALYDALRVASDQHQVLLRRRLFHLLRDTLGRDDDAADVLAFPVEVPPDATGALQNAEQQLAADDPEAAVAILAEAARAARSSEAQYALMIEEARLLEVTPIGDTERAERVYRRLRILDPRSLPALCFYREWYAEQDEPRRAYATLAQLHAALTADDVTEERIGIAREMADLAERALESPDKAIEAWRRVIADDAVDAHANAQLRRLYESTRRWHALAEHIDAWTRALPEDSVSQRVELLFELIEIYQDAGRLPMEDMVIATYQRIVGVSPTEVRALDSLATRYEDRERWNELIEVLARRVEVTTEPAELLGLFQRLAEIYLERIRSDTEAIPVLERILELDTGNLEIVRKLRDIYRRRHDDTRLYQTYQRELELLDEGDRLDVLVELARLATEQLFKADEAAEWWRQVLAIDPAHEAALAAMQDLHAEQEDWPAYVQLLEQRLEGAGTRKKRVEVLQELGEVLYRRLGDEDRALEVFAEVCEISPFNTRARGFLQRLYVKRRSWEHLQGLFAPRDDWKGYVALLRDFARKSEDGELIADLYSEAATIEQERLSDRAKAQKSLRAALDAAPARVDVARRLITELSERLPKKAKAGALEVIARHDDDKRERESAWRELAGLRTSATNAGAALDAWCHALQLGAEQGHVEVLDEVVAAATKAGAWERASEAIAETLGRLPEGATEARIQLHRSLGSIQRSRLGDADGAISHYRWILQLQPGDPDALDALEEIHLSQNDFEGLEVVLRARAEQSSDPRVARGALRRLGELYEDVFIDAERAAATYQDLLDGDPDDAEALGSLREVLLLEEHHAELAAALEDLLPRLSDGGRRAALQLELAELYRAQLAEPAVAVEHLRDLLEHPDADRAAVVEALQAMFEAEEAPGAVAPVLELVVREADDDTQLARILEVRLATAGTLDERLAIADELATLYESTLDDVGRAFDTRAARFRLDPDERETWSELVRLAEAASRRDDLAALWRSSLQPDDETPSPTVRTATNALRVALAELLGAQGEADDEAVALYEAVIEDADNPADHPEVLTKLETLYEGREQWEELVATKLLASDAVLEGASRRQKILDACTLLADTLERPEDALLHYERLPAADPTDADVAVRLEATYERLERWEELASHYERRAAALTDDDHVDRARLARARVRRDRLGEAVAASETFVSLVASEAVGAEAREALLALVADPETTERLRKKLAKTLEAYYVEHEDSGGRAALLEVRAERAATGAAKARLLLEAANLLLPDGTGDLDAATEEHRARAFELFGRALVEAPTSAEAANALDALAEQGGTWERYADVVTETAERCPDAKVAATLWRRVAVAAEQQLADEPRAILAWEALLGEDRRRGGTHRDEGLDALDRLYERAGRPADRVVILQRKAERVAQPKHRLALLREEAQVLHGLGRRDEAAVALRKILHETRATRRRDLLRKRAEAVEHLEVLLTEDERYGELVELLVDSASLSRDPDAQRQQLYRAAELSEERLGDRAAAAEIYERVLGIDGYDEIALGALDRIYQLEERWADKAQLFDAHLELAGRAGDEDRQKILLFTLGQLRENRLQDVAGAVEDYGRALALDAQFAPCLAALTAHGGQDGPGVAARRLLADAHRRAGEAQRLADVLAATLAHEDEGADAVAIHAELAEIHLALLDAPELAWEHAAAAYGAAPTGEEGLVRRDLAVQTAKAAVKPSPLATLLLEAHEDLGADERQARVESDIDVLERELSLEAEALAPFWWTLLNEDAAHRDALARLEALAREQDDVPALVKVLGLTLEATENDEERRRLLLERGDLLSTRADEPDEAIACYEEVLVGAPGDDPTYERLHELYRRLDRALDLSDLLERRLAVIEDTHTARELRAELGTLAWRELDDPSRAVELFRTILTDAPDHEEALRALESMWGEGLEREPIFRILEPTYEARSDWDKLVALYSSTLEQEGQTDLHIECLTKVARIQLEHLGDPAAAYATTKALVSRVEEPDEHVVGLEDLAGRLDGWPDLAAYYEELVIDGRGSPRLITRLAKLLEDRLDDAPRATRYYGLALERAPDDGDARAALTALLTSSERWEDLVAHHRRMAEAALDLSDKLGTYGEAADVLEQRLGRPGDAAEVLAEALAVDPTDHGLAERIAGLLETAGKRERLHEHYRSWIDRASDADAADLRLRLAISLLTTRETAPQGIAELRSLLEGEARDAAVQVLGGFLEDPSREASDGWRGPIEQAAELYAGAIGDAMTDLDRARISEARLRITPVGLEQRKLRIDTADLYDAAGEADKAFSHYAEALRRALGDPEVEDRLEDLASRRARWAAVAALYASILDAGADDEVQNRYLLKLANIHEDMLGDPGAAATWFERLLAVQPRNQDALLALATHYRETEAAEDEVRILGIWLEQGPTATDAGSLRRRLAQVLMDVLGEPDRALELLSAELPDAAHEPDLRQRLERLYGGAERFADLVALYDTALEGGELDGDVRQELLAKKAQIAETRLEDFDAARDACYALLDVAPGHGFALASAERIERHRQDWVALDDVLRRRLDIAEDRVPILIVRADNALEHIEGAESDALAHALEADEGTPTSASPSSEDGPLVAVLERLLRHESTRIEASKRLEPRYEAREDWAGLVNVLAMRQAAASDPEEDEALATRIAGLVHGRIGNGPAALRTLLSALGRHPGRKTLRDAVSDLADAVSGWADAASAIEAILEREDDAATVREVASWLGAIYRDELAAPRRAAHAFERVLGVDELNTDAMEALDALYRDIGDWDALRRLLDARLASMSDADRPGILSEMAELATKRDGPGAALPIWRELLWERPEHEGARAALAALLEQPETIRAAADILEPVYRKEGAWAELARVVERLIVVAPSPAEAARLHARAADIYDSKLDDESSAFEHYAKALEGSPGETDLLRRLERIAANEGRWPELADALEQVVAQVEIPARRAETLLHLAQIHEVKTDKPDRAIDALRQVLEHEPEQRAALVGLRRLLAGDEQKRDRLDVVVRLAALTTKTEARLELWQEARDLAAELGDDEVTLEACRACLDIDSGDESTYTQLTTLYERLERHAELAELLTSRADRLEDSTRVAALRLRLAKVREHHLDAREAAIDDYAEAWERDPSLTEAFDSLARLYREDEGWEDLYALLAARADALGSDDAEASVALWLELGDLAATELDDIAEAIRSYQRAVDLSEDCAPAIEALLRIYAEQGRQEDLAELYIHKAQLTDDDDERRELMVSAAALYVDELGQPDEAEPLLDEVLADAPQHTGAMRVMGRLRVGRGEHARAAELFESLRDNVDDAERTEILVTLGRLYRQHLDRPDDALRALMQARELDPEHEGVAETLRDLFQVTGSWDDLKQIFVQEYEAASTPAEQCERALALAKLHVEQLDDDAGFLEWISKAQAARRDSRAVAEAWIAFHSEREQWDEVAPRLEWLVNYLEGKKVVDELPRRAHELGQLLERLEQPDKALEYYKMAMNADGTYLDNLVDYGRLLVAREQWDKALRVHQNLLTQRHKLADEAARNEVLYRLALACCELGQQAKARQYLRRVLAKDPAHAEALALKERVG